MGLLHRTRKRRGEAVWALLDEEGAVVVVVRHPGRPAELIKTNVLVFPGHEGWDVVIGETEMRIVRTSWPGEG